MAVPRSIDRPSVLQPLSKMRVFVHLARGFGATQWQARWKRGAIIGLNERLPYGYFWAEEDGCTVQHSEDHREGWLGKALRLAVRAFLGFDLIHAWRNRRGIFAAEIVWTGTESQALAVLLLLWRHRARPQVIAQTIWLLDNWPRLWPPKRWLYARLLGGAGVLTVHSDEGLKTARLLFPHRRVMTMPYGIKADEMICREHREAPRPIRILSAGTDRHRDWATLLAVMRDWPDAELRIVAPRLPGRLKPGANVTALVRQHERRIHRALSLGRYRRAGAEAEPARLGHYRGRGSNRARGAPGGGRWRRSQVLF